MVFQRMAEGEMRAMEKEDILALLKRTGLSDYEAKAYLAALATVTGYTVTGNELDLFADEQEILTYTMK